MPIEANHEPVTESFDDDFRKVSSSFYVFSPSACFVFIKEL
jgi:hypothetical protein